MKRYLGVDIGGTKIAAAVFSEDGKMITRSQRSTPQEYSTFILACKSAIADLGEEVKDLSTGVGIPGILDRNLGRVFLAPNLPFLKEKPLADDLSFALSRSVMLENDANCAALAEALDGAGAGFDLVFGLILGTGVGGALVHKGRLISGANGLSGEIGHIPMPFRTPDMLPQECGCGQTDCLEKVVSGIALARQYEKAAGEKLDVEDIVDRAQAGEATAMRILDTYYENVAKAMTVVLNSFDPDIIVVSGGVSGLTPLYKEVPLRWSRYALAKPPKTAFVRATLGADAGLRGAAWLWRS